MHTYVTEILRQGDVLDAWPHMSCVVSIFFFWPFVSSIFSALFSLSSIYIYIYIYITSTSSLEEVYFEFEVIKLERK